MDFISDELASKIREWLIKAKHEWKKRQFPCDAEVLEDFRGHDCDLANWLTKFREFEIPSVSIRQMREAVLIQRPDRFAFNILRFCGGILANIDEADLAVYAVAYYLRKREVMELRTWFSERERALLSEYLRMVAELRGYPLEWEEDAIFRIETANDVRFPIWASQEKSPPIGVRHD
jgi:hypothetical protein